MNGSNFTNATVTNNVAQSGSKLSDQIVFLVFCLSLSLVIIAGNGLIILAYRTNTRLRTKANTFLVSLAVSDILVGFISLPCWIIFTQLKLRADSLFYGIFISFDIFTALTSVLHLTAISIERFIAIGKPFLYPTLSSFYYKCTLVVAWCLAAFLAGLFSTLKKFGVQFYHVPAALLIGFIGPLFVICTMYCRIFRIAKTLINREPAIKEAEEELAQDKPRKKTVIKKEHKVAVTVLIITGLFFAAWLPYYVILTLGVVCYPQCFPQEQSDVTRLVAFSKWMHYGNSAVNFFIYSFRDHEMRTTFVRLLTNRLTRLCIDVNANNNQDVRHSVYTSAEPNRPLRKKPSI